MDADFSPETSRLRAKDSDGKEYVVGSLTVREQIFGVGEILVVLAAKNLAADALIGKKLTCSVYDGPSPSAKKEREFEGYIEHIRSGVGDEPDGMQQYEFVLKPWFWLLTFSRNFRVFQNKSTQSIVSTVLEDAGFRGEFNFLSIPSLVRPYCLQYGESDFDFVCRLLAEVGVNFFFEQKIGSHKMVMQDAESTSSKVSGNDYVYATDPNESKNTIYHWQVSSQFHAPATVLANYDYEQTKYTETSKTKSSDKLANAGSLVKTSTSEPTVSGKLETLADLLVKRRNASEESNYVRVAGKSWSPDLTVSERFSLKAHFDSAQVGDYLLVSVNHFFTTEPEGIFRYENEFNCVSTSRKYFPAVISKPTPPGFTSGVVEGKTPGEPAQDDQARVRVRFHWDKAEGDSPSCWIRVAQLMAGKTRGTQFIPRAGDEVLIGFLDEDIDRPVIVGSVYNSVNTAIFSQTNSTQTGMSTKLSGKSNEFIFDDKADSEVISINAAKDLTVEVENNLTETVKGEFSQTVDKKAVTTAKETYLLDVTESLTEKSKKILIEGTEEIEVKVGSNSVKINTEGITVTASELKLSSTAKTEISATGAMSLSSTAAASLSGSAGVKISSDATTDIQGQAGASIQSSAQTKVSGAAITEISGGLVKIN
ncbi:MAG TPA: type VI secretion system tip protein VgrG [Gammaproteobacteria bacterium]|nr:type VI secretion system tip protein VgrG [Gammaproteobacteria bacterium]